VARWESFAAQAPELAEAGRRLLYQFGVGLGFLATVRPDGGPRLHPMCPILAEGGLYTFLVPSPKRNDLVRDPRYALHSFPPAEVDDEFYVTGRARRIDDPDLRTAVAATYHAEVAADHDLFELDVERCLHAAYRARGDWPPRYTRWREA
jgi:hypothetical protein